MQTYSAPIKTSETRNKFISASWIHSPNMPNYSPLPNKETKTMTATIFDYWICWFRVPLDLVTDEGTQYSTKILENFIEHFGSAHLRHPQCNSQAEGANRTITTYLTSILEESNLDWEPYLYPLIFSYSTSFQHSIKNFPFFLTFRINAQQL